MDHIDLGRSLCADDNREGVLIGILVCGICAFIVGFAAGCGSTVLMYHFLLGG